MGEITMKGKKVFMRSLTRGEIKQLKKYGYTIFGCVPDFDQSSDAMDECFKLVLSEDQIAYLDSVPNKKVIDVWKEILAETYGSQDEEKNLSGVSDGTQAKKESSIVTPAAPKKKDPINV